MLGTVLIVILILVLIGALPRWGYHDLGYSAPGAVVLLLIVVVVLILTRTI